MNTKIFVALILFLVSATFSIAQENTSLPLDAKTGLITFTKVNTIATVPASELFQRGLNWASTFYKNPTDVIRERDSVSGSLVCKARFKIMNPADKKHPTTDAGNVMYTLSIQLKEGRYRYELTAINWKQQSYYPAERWMDRKATTYQPVFESYLQQTEAEINKVLLSLEKAMSTPTAAKKDDW